MPKNGPGWGLARAGAVLCRVLSRTRNHSIPREWQGIDADQCVSGADQLRSSVHWRGVADEPRRRACLDFGRLVCRAVRWGDLAIYSFDDAGGIDNRGILHVTDFVTEKNLL